MSALLRPAILPGLLLLPLLVTGTSCAGNAPPKDHPATAPPAARPAVPPAAKASDLARSPAFREERAWQHLVNLCNMGPRAHGTPGMKAAQEYIRAHLKSCGVEPRDQVVEYQGSRDAAKTAFTNIVARFGPSSGPWIILGGHYDTRLWADEDPNPAHRDRPIAGANDGGSGTATLLEIASVLGERPPPFGVVLIFFDGEDYGAKNTDDYFVGSRGLAARWSEFFPEGKPQCAVIIDMVADADLRFLREGNSQQVTPWVNDLIWRAAADLHPEHFAPRGVLPVTDDHTALIELGIPSTLLIDFTYPWWHTLSDTLDKCSAASMGVTGRVLLRALVDNGLPKPPAR